MSYPCGIGRQGLFERKKMKNEYETLKMKKVEEAMSYLCKMTDSITGVKDSILNKYGLLEEIG